MSLSKDDVILAGPSTSQWEKDLLEAGGATVIDRPLPQSQPSREYDAWFDGLQQQFDEIRDIVGLEKRNRDAELER